MEYLINKLRQANIRISVIDNQLKLSVPEGADVRSLIAEVKEYKQDLIDYIQKARAAMPQTAEGPATYELFYQQKKEYLRFLILGDQAFNMNFVLQFDDVDVPAIQKAVRTVFERHESLRTTYLCNNGVMQQHVRSMIDDPIQYFDLSNEDNIEQAARELFYSAVKRKFNFEKELLVDVKLVKISPRTSYLSFTVHHVCCDSISREILKKEVTAVYEGELLPPITLQYKDYARFVNNLLKSEAGAAARDFYRERIGSSVGSYKKKLREELERASVDPTKKPFDEAFGSVVNLYPEKGASFRTCVKAPVLNKVKELAASCGSSVNMALTAAFATILHSISGRDTFRFYIPFTNRTSTEFENIVGWLTSEIVLVVDVKEDLRELISDVTAGFLEASPHQLYPHEAIMNDLDIPLDELVDAMLNFVKIPGAQMEYFTPAHDDNGSGHFNLRLAINEFDNGLYITVNYNLNMYTKEKIEEMMDMFTNFLSYATCDRLQPVARNYQ
ncbi:MAG TPA: condensation domain-containing protein [Chitinophagaceae bacterium]|nr:condensation domain-containing protein [Chitinophagaceae bacterium]